MKRKKFIFISLLLIFASLLPNFLWEVKNTEASWQPNTFLTQEFWDSDWTSGNLISALFGDGTTGSSAYNRYWEDMDCNLETMKNRIYYVNFTSWNRLNDLTWNAIYILSGAFINITLEPESCSAIVGMGDVSISSSSSNIFNISAKKNVIIDNIKIKWNVSNNAGIYLLNAHNNTINNVEVWWAKKWIYLEWSDYNMFHNIKSHDNDLYGFQITLSWDHNYISDSQIYNNSNDGIRIENSDYNVINNILTYNNVSKWIYFNTSNYWVVNNSQTYNNRIWIYFDTSNYWVINNSQSYNNNYDEWIFFNHSNSGIINNSTVYNNVKWLKTNDSNYFSYYGNLKSFDNDQDFFCWTITGWTSLSFWQDGIIDTGSETLSYKRFTNPINSLWDIFLEGNDWDDLDWNLSWISSEPTKYIFGSEILKQVQPVRYNTDWELELFGTQGLDRDPNEYIAAVNMELNPADQAIVDYYYWPSREFISNRSGNNCSLWAFTVEYVNSGNIASKLLNPSPWILWHTIYVIQNDNYNIWAATININDNCVAIVNQWSGATLQRTSNNQNPIIQVKWQENIILNNLNLNGRNASNHGILLEKVWSQSSNNNTINNVKSYSHRMNGIMLWVSASHNTIMNTQTWNNQQNGIEIYLGGQYNVINNSLSYNNHWYGLRFGNISKYNTINNGQFFNNWIGGIFADFTTEQNIINNVHTYNNTEYGINFKRSSGNNLNNVYTYNNKIWINMTDISCVNNKFNWDLMLFGNSSWNMMGTSGTDNFLSSELWNGTLVWLPGTLQSGGDSMNCAWATNPTIDLNNGWFLNIWSGCVNTWRQTAWTPPNANSIDYMFGLGISKQIKPVWYTGWIISLLDNQHNPSSYIWEVNPIIYTNPGNIIIRSGNEIDLALNINHEMNVTYNTGMINHNFDVALTLYPSSTNWHIQIKTAGTWNSIWTGMTGVNFSTLEWMRVVVTTPNEHYKNVSGTLYIGTSQYWYSTGYFNIRTIADQTPPSIIRSGNIYPGGVWHNQSNTWQAIVTGAYATSGWAQYVTWADACHTWLAVPALIYHGTLQNIVLNPNYNTLNEKYVCIVAKDNVNNQYTTGLSNQIKISKVEFVDNIALWPVYYDIIDINFQNVQNFGYRRVNSGSQCNNSLSGLDLIAYETPIVVNDISLNGKYMCVYWEDWLGSGKYMPSANKLNIIDYSQFVHFIDDVSADWVLSDTISVYFTWTNFFVYKKYKRVENAIDCNNSWWMTDYTGAITITNEDLNWKHFCLYSKEINSWIENYLVSTNKLKIDRTKPDTPTIISPINEQSIYWLIVETTWANDTQSGLSGFDYEIALDATFLDNVSVWEVNSTGNVFSPVFNKNDRKYSIRTRAIDKVGNKSERSNIVTFNYKNLSNFEFINVVNAQLWTAYVSNEITMWGLGVDEVIEVKVSSGRLFRNWNLLWTTGLVKNDDKLTIKMISSSEYDETVETKLTIANRLVPRKITTMSSGFSLTGSLIDSWACAIISSGDYLNAESILNSIVSMYTNPTQLQAFLLVMKSMLQDNIALAGNTWVDNMKCLLYLVDQYLITHFGMGTDPNVHKTPSCKEYLIVHNTEDNTYYSPNTIKKTKFGSRDELVKFLDFNNPGDCHINTYWNTVSYDSSDPNRHIAPNGKVYRIESNNLWYSSPDFINIKHFATINELRAFIDKNNPAIVVWDHLVDATFEPIVHTAPNDKTYKIYKTNRGYMSYKLIKVQYFDTLESLKNYINKNNQK